MCHTMLLPNKSKALQATFQQQKATQIQPSTKAKPSIAQAYAAWGSYMINGSCCPCQPFMVSWQRIGSHHNVLQIRPFGPPCAL